MIKLALKKGIAPRVETANMEDAKAFIEMGVRHFCVEQDLGIISQWCKQQEKSGIKSLLASL
jgi:4-hydroxy-2-oxoheptanedioate aldolase